jgi:hypothetical protein
MKEDEPPVFNEWTKMFLDGLRVLIVGLIYEIIPILILMAGFIMIMISQGCHAFRLTGHVTGPGNSFDRGDNYGNGRI